MPDIRILTRRLLIIVLIMVIACTVGALAGENDKNVPIMSRAVDVLSEP